MNLETFNRNLLKIKSDGLVLLYFEHWITNPYVYIDLRSYQNQKDMLIKQVGRIQLYLTSTYLFSSSN